MNLKNKFLKYVIFDFHYGYYDDKIVKMYINEETGKVVVTLDVSVSNDEIRLKNFFETFIDFLNERRFEFTGINIKFV